eukprot:CAMPEP_0202685752 /NCGR_PEP_ID=MMETSP1385-20130828/1577_1 /ASSEMBLY_ACC=CAM_ASM_000861 /TAXON_ID=933848 /ORGANISM="Elphidium margaritaceum" /LENGTH=286 /DNA_ID=CAMNT_0049340181 /DNA_START=59 /DNA_END=919 /DNA_ORIENTATION=-
MWVQEGVDFKDADETVSSTVSFTPMVARFYGQCQSECDSKAADSAVIEPLEIDPQYQAFTIDFDKTLTLSPEIDANSNTVMEVDTCQELDLTIFGKKIESISTTEEPPDLEPPQPSFGAQGNAESVFDACCIASENDWNECMRCSHHGVLLVVELYCSVFGPSAMYSFVRDRLSQDDTSKTKLAQLSIAKMKQIAQCKQVIVNCDRYTPSPIPSFVLIKNGAQIDTLQGVRPLDLLRLIEQKRPCGASSLKESERPDTVDHYRFSGSGDGRQFIQGGKDLDRYMIK